MKSVDFKDVKPYQAPKHFGCSTLKLQGREETGCQTFWMGLSHFLPGGGAELDASPVEKVYFVIEGEVTVITGAKEKIVLKKWDSIHFGPGEEREIVNATNYPATMLVAIEYPNASAAKKG